MFTFTPLLGAQSDSSASQSLLELDGGIKILIDVGWDVTFNVEALQAIEEHVSSLSFILLTHPTLDHLGAFAHLCKHVPQFKSIPVYATSPVISLGRTLLQDLYASSLRAATTVPAESFAEAAFARTTGGTPPSILLQPPTSEEIAGYFSLINPLMYSQPLQPIASSFSSSVDGVTITAYSAGHTLGGTIWHVQHGLESIIYAVDWNQAKENTLSGAAWLGGSAEIIEPLRRPTALICSSKGIERHHAPGGRRKRDDRLLEAIDQTVKAGGIVLIPTDSSARVLELAYLVEQHWRSKLTTADASTYRIAKAHLASRTAGSTLRFARSMVEWMDEGVVRAMEVANDAQKVQKGGEDKLADQTPLDFRHIKLVERKKRLQRILNEKRPGVILASDQCLDWGLSIEIMQKLCADSRNLVILTEQHSLTSDIATSTISAQLWNIWQQQVKRDAASIEIVRKNDLQVNASHPEVESLRGEELSMYQQYLARRRQVQSTQQVDSAIAGATNVEGAADDQSSASSESSDESDNEQQGRALNLTATLNQSKRKIGLTDAELGVNILMRKKNVYDYDVRGKRGREKIFPFASKRNKDDEYGDIIRPEDYLRAEERDEDAQAETNKADDSAAMGQKRKWDDSANKTQDARRQRRGENKRQRTADGQGLTSSTRTTNGDAHANSDSSDSDSDLEPEEAMPTGPQKITFRSVSLTINMGICYIDFSGLHEKRDLQMLLPLIKPRKLVITSGTSAETASLAEDCRVLLGEDIDDNSSGAKMVFTPRVGETVDASVDTNAWSIKLTRELVKRLAWQTVKGLGVVAVTARLGVAAPPPAEDEDDEQVKKKAKLAIVAAGEGKADPAAPEIVLDVMPDSDIVGSAQTTQPIHVGDLRIADLRRLMQANGHVAEFKGEGVLLIDGVVIVRKTAGGTIDVEGAAYGGAPAGSRFDASASFFDVRRRIYEGLAVVAGG